MPFWETLGTQAAGAGMGLLLGEYNDNRQLRQQERLQALQMRGNRELMDYSYQKQLEMWKATNYQEQIKQLKAAGLNPALLYGMKGGGGITTGSPAGTGVQGATAPVGGNEVIHSIGQGMQLELLKAQKENIQADTLKKRADTVKTAGVDTTLQEKTIEDLAETIQNKQLGRQLTRVQIRMEQLQADLLDTTFDDVAKTTNLIMQKTNEELQQAKVKTRIDQATERDIISTVKWQLATLIAHKGLIDAQTTTEKGKPQLQQAQIDELFERAKDITRQGQQRWRAIEMEGRTVTVEEEKNLRDELKASGLNINAIDLIMDLLIINKLGTTPQGHTPVRGLHNRN